MKEKHKELGKKILNWSFIGLIILSIYAMGRVHGAFDVAFKSMTVEEICLSTDNTYRHDMCIINPEKEYCYQLTTTDAGRTILCLNKKTNIVSKGVIFTLFGLPIKQLDYNFQNITI